MSDERNTQVVRLIHHQADKLIPLHALLEQRCYFRSHEGKGPAKLLRRHHLIVLAHFIGQQADCIAPC